MAKIERISVIGAGNMGSGIAQKIAQEGMTVVLVDIDQSFVDRGLKTIRTLLDQGVDRRIFSPEQVQDILSRITGTTDLADVRDVDLVIEAIVEEKSAKEALFKDLDRICHARTILATNTSSFYVRDFAAVTHRPDRFIGLHYFFHPAKNRLLEVIPCEGTSQETLNKALDFARRHGKTPIPVKDAPGFAVNRFFVPFLNEAVRMLEQGVADIPTIEEGACQALKIGMGPFQLMNITGVPIAFHAATTLGKELGDFYAPAELLKKQTELGQMWNLEGSEGSEGSKQSRQSMEELAINEVQSRFLGVCLGVAAALVDEGVATREDTDRGAKIGLRWARGPFELMNRMGVDKTFDAVQAICDRYPGFAMPGLLERQVKTGQPFEFQWVDLEVAEKVAWITINRPEAMNALNQDVVAQLDHAFSQAEAAPQVAAVVIQGAGKTFVAGADIGFFVKKIRQNRIADITQFTRQGHELFMRIENSTKLTIVLLDGLSLGGGSELALAAQAVIATPKGSMGFPESSIGIYPGLGGMMRLARHVGPDLAKYYSFTGSILKAQDLKDLGIAQALVAPEEIASAISKLMDSGKPDKNVLLEIPERFQERARVCNCENVARLLNAGLPVDVDKAFGEKTAKQVSRKAPLALKMIHEIIDAQKGIASAQAVEVELGRLEEIFSTADALEGLSAVGKRLPEFKGL